MRINNSKFKRLAKAGALVLSVVGFLSAGKMQAQPSGSLDPKFWFPNGPVNAILATNDTVYIAGDFTYVGPHTGPVVLFDQASGGVEASGPKVVGSVKAVVADGSGGWFIGGSFTVVGNLNITNLAHLNRDLSLDATWNAQISGGVVNALALDGSRLYMGGSFSRVNNQINSGGLFGIAISNGVVNWNPTLSGSVNAMQLFNDSLYVGGNFYSIGNSNVQNLGVISTNVSALATSFNPSTVDQPVLALFVTSNTVYVGGQFTTIGTKSKNRLAALDINTAIATAWNPNPNGIVRALWVTSSNAFVGGDFTTISIATRHGFASLALTGTGAAQPLDISPQGPSTTTLVRSLLLQGESLYVGGQFTNALGATNFLVVGVDLTTGKAIPTPAGIDFNGPLGTSYGVNALAASGGNILAIGDFQSVGGVPRLRAAALSIKTGEPLSWAPGFDGPILCMAMLSNSVYVGGTFTYYNTTNDTPSAGYGLGAVDAISGNPLSFNFLGTNTSQQVSIAAVAASPTTVYAGGNFTSVGGVARRTLVALDPVAGSVIPGFNANLGGGFLGITSMNLSGTNLYIGGDFTTVNTLAIPRLAAVAPDTGAVDPAWVPTPNQAVNLMTSSSGVLYIGGSFTSINLDNTGALTLNHFAAFSLVDNSIVPIDAALNSSDSVTALGAGPAAVYVGGSFAAAGGNFIQNLADLSTVDATPFNWNPSPDVGPSAIALDDRYAFMGGAFRSFGVGTSNRVNGFFAAFSRAPALAIRPSTGGQVEIDMTTGDGSDAVLQSAPTLNSASWNTVQTFSAGLPQTTTVPASSTLQFYRMKAN